MNRKQRRATKGAATRSSTEADRLVDAGLAAQQEGRDAEAALAYTKALAIDAKNLSAHMNLGTVFSRVGRQRAAASHLRRALSLAPDSAEVHEDAGAVFVELGRWDLALAALRRALELNPRNAVALTQLGFVLLENGLCAEAVAVLRRAIEIDSAYAAAPFLLHRALYDDRNPAPALDPLKRAAKLDPDSLWYRFLLGVLLDETGDAKGSREQFDGLGLREGVYVGAVNGWEYAKKMKNPRTRFFATTRATLLAGLADATSEGAVLEFGVRYGISTRWLAQAHSGKVHGFDSFEGLPEQWHIMPKGSYSTHGEVPELPANVALHVGWFDATLPVFVKEHADPVRFMNVDCDLYSSTRAIFDLLGDRVRSGTVIVFDEYLGNDAWKQDEYKAFQEVLAARRWSYEYLAFSIANFQATVRIL